MTNRPNIRRIAVAATTALVLAGAVPVVASASTEADVIEGALDWGVKESFRGYVASPVADGEIEVSDGATQNSDGSFHFPGGSGTVGDGSAELVFSGTVSFTGHDGALEVTISNPVIQINGGDGALLADVSSLSQDGELVEFTDVALGELDLSGASLEPDSEGVVAVDGVAATLTDAGAPAFGGFYEAGEALDPVSFTVQTSGAGQADDSADDSDDPDTTVDDDSGAAGDSDDADNGGTTADDENALPKTGVPWALVAVGGLVMVALGTAFVLLGRRRVAKGAQQ